MDGQDKPSASSGAAQTSTSMSSNVASEAPNPRLMSCPEELIALIVEQVALQDIQNEEEAQLRYRHRHPRNHWPRIDSMSLAKVNKQLKEIAKTVYFKYAKGTLVNISKHVHVWLLNGLPPNLDGAWSTPERSVDLRLPPSALLQHLEIDSDMAAWIANTTDRLGGFRLDQCLVDFPALRTLVFRDGYVLIVSPWTTQFHAAGTDPRAFEHQAKLDITKAIRLLHAFVRKAPKLESITTERNWTSRADYQRRLLSNHFGFDNSAFMRRLDAMKHLDKVMLSVAEDLINDRHILPLDEARIANIGNQVFNTVMFSELEN